MKSKLVASLFRLAFALTSLARAADWAPASLSGYKAVVVISNGSGYFANWGGYRLTVGNSIVTVTPLTWNVIDQTGTYTYTKLSATQGRVILTDSATGVVATESLIFTSATSAEFSLSSAAGSQTGTLILEGVASQNRFVNLSTRGYVAGGNNVLIGGLVITGTAPKQVLIRAAGPALISAGIPIGEALSDPALTLHRSVNGKSTVVATNDDWSAANVGTSFAQTGAGAWAAGSKDAALLITLEPGIYTAIVTGQNGATGIALVEAYEMP